MNGPGTRGVNRKHDQPLFEEFCDEFTREMNRLRMEHRASLSSAERELERVRAGIRKIIDAIEDGFAGAELKAEMDDLQARKESLLAQMAGADAPVPLLHSNLAVSLPREGHGLGRSTPGAGSRSEAAEGLRGLVDAIVLVPDGNELRIDLKGNLAAMLSAAQNAKRSPEGDLSLQIAMVAGASQPTEFGVLLGSGVGTSGSPVTYLKPSATLMSLSHWSVTLTRAQRPARST